jgi:hypothetical protein
VRRSEHGQPTQLAFAPSAHVEARRRLEFLVALAQRPSGPLSAAETPPLAERDGTGPYQASYLRRADGAIVRKKLSYDPEASRGTGLRVVSSEAVLVLAGESLASVTAHERLEFQSGALSVDSTTRVTAQGPAERASFSQNQLSALSHELPFGQASREAADEEDVALAQGLSPQAAVDAVLTATSSIARRQAVKSLAALGRLNSSTLPVIRGALAAATTTELAIPLLNALSQIGGRPAVDALSAAAQDPRQSERVQREALASLDAPRIARQDAYDVLLGSLHGPLRMTAALQLGTLAYAVRSTQPELAAQGVAQLAAEYRAASNAGERGLLMTALGNAGFPDLIQQPPSTRLEPALRSRWVYALRKLPGPAVENAVASALRDTDVAVRQSALNVCAEWRDARPCPGLEAVARADRDATTRERALRVIALRARDAAARVAAAKLMHGSAARDSAPRVRKLAQQLAEQLEAPATENAWDALLNQSVTSNGSMP